MLTDAIVEAVGTEFRRSGFRAIAYNSVVLLHAGGLKRHLCKVSKV